MTDPDCPECHGTGKVRYLARPYSTWDAREVEHDCPLCSGQDQPRPRVRPEGVQA